MIRLLLFTLVVMLIGAFVYVGYQMHNAELSSAYDDGTRGSAVTETFTGVPPELQKILEGLPENGPDGKNALGDLANMNKDLLALSKEVRSRPKAKGEIYNMMETLQEFVKQKQTDAGVGMESTMDKQDKVISPTMLHHSVVEEEDPEDPQEPLPAPPSLYDTSGAPVPSPTKRFGEMSRKTGSSTKCRFFPSFSESYACPEGYPEHSGATFSGKASGGLTCNGKGLDTERAKAYAVVRNGGIRSITVISGGSHYDTEPRVRIQGVGKHARAKAILGNGVVKSIRVIHKGDGYTATPTIVVDAPDAQMHCHMCCRFSTDS